MGEALYERYSAVKPTTADMQKDDFCQAQLLPKKRFPH
jgi:hypothetical protein